MKDDYEDIINLPHHVSATRPQMSMHERAAMFSPFAALTGYDEAISETGRQTEARVELGDEAKAELNRKLQFLGDTAMAQPELTVTYFAPDQKKTGGAYVSTTGRLKKIDEYERVLVLTSGAKIPLDDVVDIVCGMFGV